MAIDAASNVADKRRIALPADLVQARKATREKDTRLAAEVRDCLNWARDASAWTLSHTIICQAPIVLTPVGNGAGVAYECWSEARGSRWTG